MGGQDGDPTTARHDRIVFSVRGRKSTSRLLKAEPFLGTLQTLQRRPSELTHFHKYQEGPKGPLHALLCSSLDIY